MKLLTVEDDIAFANTLMRRLTKAGFSCFHAANSNDALLMCHRHQPDYILLDMNLALSNSESGQDQASQPTNTTVESGLALIKPMRSACPKSYIVLLTGFASIATAVDAIKLGANDYLSKPVDMKTLLAALKITADKKIQPLETKTNTGAQNAVQASETKPMSADEAEWQHIQQTLKFNNGNISETARQLSMHRRTLQRKLQKKPRLN